MTLRTLALKNVWRSRGRYLAYVGSAAFSVAIYFLYTTLTYHPTLRGGYIGAQYVTLGTQAAAIVIAVFTFLFLLYSSAAFARFRMKEFGLLTMLGLTRGQLARMILWENLLVAASALAIGLGLGLLFLKLFFMAISALLRLPEELPFYAGAPVWIQTVAVFGGFFLVVSLASLRGAFRNNVVDLIRASRKPKEVPAFSLTKALAGLILVAAGYTWASQPNPMVILLGVVPVTAMVSLGTYLLLKEGSIAFLRWLHRRDRLFYRPRPFLVISQLVFKMQDNYRVLSAVSLLIAVILSAMGTFYSLYVVLAEDALTRAPQAIQIVLGSEEDAVGAGEGALRGTGESALRGTIEGAVESALRGTVEGTVESGADTTAGGTAQRADRVADSVQQLLTRHGVTGLIQVRLSLIEGTLRDRTVYVIPNSIYQRLHRPSGRPQPIETTGDAVLVYPFVSPQSRDGGVYSAPPRDGLTGEQTVMVGGEQLALQIVPDRSGRLFNEPFAAYVLVVADETFKRLAARPEVQRLTVLAWTGPVWRGKAMEAVIADLLRTGVLPEDSLTTTLEHFRSLIAAVGVALFIGLFVSLVFFAATCSLLYFRLFTELDEDRRYLRRLHELGLSRRDASQLSRLQNAVIFLVPFVVGLVHSTFAMKALSTLIMKNVIFGGWLVALGYLAAYILYFAAADSVYRRAVGSQSLA